MIGGFSDIGDVVPTLIAAPGYGTGVKGGVRVFSLPLVEAPLSTADSGDNVGFEIWMGAGRLLKGIAGRGPSG